MGAALRIQEVDEQLREGRKYASRNRTKYDYDDDMLMTNAGDEDLTPNSATGLLSGTSLDNVSDSYSYDSSYAELSAYTASYTGSPSATLLSESYTRDSLGRISSKTETVRGTSHTYGYSYDSGGRLTAVTKDSSAYSSYTYDGGSGGNSNRTSGSTAGTSFTATYDAQDRLTRTTR